MSAPAHTVVSIQQFFTKTGMTPVLHPPYSPDLTLSNVFWFPQVKKKSSKVSKKQQKH